MPITKQTIAIIGVQGDIAPAIAKGVCTKNYRLLLFDENESEIIKLAEEIRAIDHQADVEAPGCSHLASWESDIIILSVDEVELRAITRKIKDVTTQKIVLRILNRSGLNGSDDMYTTLPHSKIAEITDDQSAGSDGKKVLKIKSGDADTLNTAAELVKAAGYDSRFNPS